MFRLVTTNLLYLVSIQMYSEFLKPFRPLYHLIGVLEDCELVKKAYRQMSDERQIEFVCSQFPKFQYKSPQTIPKEPPASGGILPRYWLDKVSNIEPMLVICVFNLSKPLDPSEKWDDRLQTVHLQVNKIKWALKNPKPKRIALGILILTPANTPFPNDKTKDFLKITDKSLQIVDIQGLKAELKRIKNVWYNLWQKQIQQRIKGKAKDESFRDQTKLRASIKTAVLQEMLNSEDISFYNNAQFLCKRMYQGLEKGKADDISRISSRFELRLLGDVLFLKAFRVWIKSNPVQALNKFRSHYLEFRSKYLDKVGTHMYYEEISWKSLFLSEIVNILLTVGTKDQTVDSKISEISKGVISYNMELFKLKDSFQVEKVTLEKLDSQYFGRMNYKFLQDGDSNQHFKNTRLSQLTAQPDQYLTDAMSLIARLREGARIKKHEDIYYTINSCRMYILSNNLESALATYNSMRDTFLKKNDFFVLNCLLKEFQPLLQKHAHHGELVQFYLAAIKVSDYFRSLQKLPEFVKEVNTISAQLKSPVQYTFPNASSLVNIKVDFFTITSLLCDKIRVKIFLNINESLRNIFTSMDIRFKSGVTEASNLQILEEQIIQIEPSDFLAQEDIFEIEEVRFKSNNLVWIMKGQNLQYLKKNRVFIVMPMNEPKIQATALYTKCYAREAIPIEVKVVSNNVDTKVTTKILFSQEKLDDPAMCFQSLQQEINLLNTDTTFKIQQNTPTVFYLKFPKDGERKVKLSFQIQMVKTYTNSKGQKKEVIKNKRYHHDLKFTLDNMFVVSKRFSIPSSEILTKKIQLKEGVYRLPHSQKIMIQYNISAQENLVLGEIKQEEQNNEIKFIKSIGMKDVDLGEKVVLRVFSMITIKEFKDIAKLPPLFMRWMRKEHNIENTFIDIEEQLSTKPKSVSIQLKDADNFRKNQVGVVHFRVNNHLTTKIKVRVQAVETDEMVIVGKNKTQLLLDQLSHTILTFKVMPLIVGEILLPELVIRVDQKLQAKLEKRHIAFVL